MVKDSRYRKGYKAKKSFPRLIPEKQHLKELTRFGYGMTTDEYHRVMFKLGQWSQAKYPGEIAIEIKIRTASELGLNKFMSNQMVTRNLGDKPPDMTQAEYNKMVVEAQRNYLKERQEYLKDVKSFIGNMFQDFVTDDLTNAIKGEASYNEAVNQSKNTAQFMDWFEALVFRLLRWDTKNQITEIEELIMGKANIGSYNNNCMTYLATLGMLLEQLKRLKINNLVEDHIRLNNGRKPTNLEVMSFDDKVEREIDGNGMYLTKVYNEIKENGITKQIRDVWIMNERTKQLKQYETPYTSMKAMINAVRETINYMMTNKMFVEKKRIDLSINATQLDKKQKCFKCIEGFNPDRVNHTWYDCFHNPKSINYKGKDKYNMNNKDKQEKPKVTVSVARYNKMKGLIKNGPNQNPVKVERKVVINNAVAEVKSDDNIDTTESSESE